MARWLKYSGAAPQVPRKRNPVGIAAGKLILAIQKEWHEVVEGPDAARAQKVMHRARVLLQASESSSVPNLLDGRTVVEYLDPAWVEMHPSVKPHVETLIAALSAHESA
jgi:hypothetical protein